jgi:hypothetical protein
VITGVRSGIELIDRLDRIVELKIAANIYIATLYKWNKCWHACWLGSEDKG